MLGLLDRLELEIALGIVDVGLTDPTATTYRLRRLPTLMVLDAGGREKNRREGPVGEVDFRDGFLDLRAVRRPS